MAQPLGRYSVSDYLALERDSTTKHEYHEGDILAMAGASPRHNLIVVALITSLSNALRGKKCLVFPSDQRLRVTARRYTYPDVQVVCGKPQFTDENPAALLNPTLIVEVASPSTGNYDRSEKFAAARGIDSLTDYVVVMQDTLHVEHYQRQADGSWRLLDLIHAEAMLGLSSLGIEIPVGAFYRGVEFDDSSD